MEKLFKVRFAPSPTGYLHLGSLRVALFNWLFARNNKGKFIIRIEDTDFSRSEKKYVDSILEPLKWVNIESDEPLTFQSDRLELYNKVALDLLNRGKAYFCFCQEKVTDNATNSDINKEYRKYSEKCRNLAPQEIEQNLKNNISYVIRFKVPKDVDKIEFVDLIRSKVTFDRDQFDDFIIVRSDNVPTYNFAVVVDDHYMQITHVLRGEEHISNTPKQILLYKACEFNLPLFGHFPLILSPDGGKLSKRYAATSVDFYRKEGFLPDALCNYLVRLGWSHGDQEVFTRQELIQYFSLDQVHKSGAVFDIKKLEWLNGFYIRNSSSSELFDYIIHNIDEHIFSNLKNWSKEQILKLLDLYKERVQTLKELIGKILDLYNLEIKVDLSANLIDNISIIDLLNKVILLLELENLWTYENISNLIKNTAKEFGIKLGQIAQPIRIALTGQISSPGIFDLILILEKEESINRIRSFINKLKE